MSKKEDFRKLSIDAQASMRKVALKLVKRGEKQSSVADVIGVSRQTISEWLSKNRRGDKYVISGKPRGRKFLRQNSSKILSKQKFDQII